MNDNINWINFIIVLGLFSSIILSCKEDDDRVQIPIVSTSTITNISFFSAKSGGIIDSDGGSSILANGLCWSMTTNPDITDSFTVDNIIENSFSSNISGLNSATNYYIRAYATNKKGTGYGEELSFTTLGIKFNQSLTYGTITDIEGNSYKTIKIGTQTWMAENLRTTRYRNGESITEVIDDFQWGNINSGAYCNYNNTKNNDSIIIFGRLYNWFAVIDNRNLAPEGWHIPLDTEWNILINYLGGENIAGDKLKESGTIHWNCVNSDTNNSSGFTALPAGSRGPNGDFDALVPGYNSTCWSSTDESFEMAWGRGVNCNSTTVIRNDMLKSGGYAVRCVKD